METTKELRIGNLVEDHNGIRCEIYAIASNSVIVTGLFGSIQRTLGICEIKPIPLTDEELKCIGFKKSNKYKEIYDKNVFVLETNSPIKLILCGTKGFYDCYSDYNPTFTPHPFNYITTNAGVKSVHQLQNLYFALTGEELA